jgi:hypothetical protein
MRRALYLLANVLGVVLILLLIDPTRPLGPVFMLLGLAAGDTKKEPMACVPSALAVQ